VSIFGVEGSLIEGVDITDANAYNYNLEKDKIAYGIK
jgi:hypothetical protein